jgi:hypothetical protein
MADAKPAPSRPEKAAGCKCFPSAGLVDFGSPARDWKRLTCQSLMYLDVVEIAERILHRL